MPELETQLEGLPPSAKLVYKILEYEGPLTQQELRSETLLGQRTVYNALQELKENGFIDSKPRMADLRQHVYHLDGD